MKIFLIVALMFACARCEDTHLKGAVGTESVLTNPEPVLKLKEPQATKEEKGTYTDTMVSELLVKVERMEKTIKSLGKNTDIDQIARDIVENKKDITYLRNVVDINEANIRDTSTLLTSSLHPIGSIIAWQGHFITGHDVPTGWQRCDGSLIERGNLIGQRTPDLNSDRLFLRGGHDSESGTVQQDAVQDHEHEDYGHTHTDSGHYHRLDDSGTQPVFEVINYDEESKTVLASATAGWHVNFNYDTDTGHAALSHEKSGLRGVAGGRVSAETRPKNMGVVYIMRIA